jgi:hypothetical protein
VLQQILAAPLAVALAPVILTALAAFFTGRYFALRNTANETKQRRDEQERHAHYLGIRVVCRLDPFVIECCDFVSDSGVEDAEGITHAQLSPPKLELPEDVDWKSISVDLMYRILSLPNDLESARRSIEFVGNEIAGPPDYEEYYEEKAIEFGQLGLTTITLCDDIRKAYGIPQRQYENWHPKELLEKAIAKARAAQSARQVDIPD